MNPLHADREHLLDLLVDGELDESDRRELLLWCERDPEGWRRCALAFLEAQCWSQQMRSAGAKENANEEEHDTNDRQPPGHEEFNALLAAAQLPALGPGGESSASRDAQSGPTTRPGARRAWTSFVGPLAMAASFLAAFALGLLARGGWPLGAARQAGDQAAGFRGVVAQENGGRGELQHDPGYSLAPREPTGQVRLVVDGPAGAGNEIQVPVVEGRAIDADFWQNQPAAVPAEIQRMLERMGHEVRQRREMLPLRFKDGRRLIVPVDQVEVRPTGNRDYQ